MLRLSLTPWARAMPPGLLQQQQRQLGPLAATFATSNTENTREGGPVTPSKAALPRRWQLLAPVRVRYLTTSHIACNQDKIKAARKLLKENNAGKVLMPDGTRVKPEDIMYVQQSFLRGGRCFPAASTSARSTASSAFEAANSSSSATAFFAAASRNESIWERVNLLCVHECEVGARVFVTWSHPCLVLPLLGPALAWSCPCLVLPLLGPMSSTDTVELAYIICRYEDADVKGTAVDGANDYGRAQRSKVRVSYFRPRV